MKNWNLAKYVFAVTWWKGNSYGNGHFNEELYQRFLKIRYEM